MGREIKRSDLYGYLMDNQMLRRSSCKSLYAQKAKGDRELVKIRRRRMEEIPHLTTLHNFALSRK